MRQIGDQWRPVKEGEDKEHPDLGLNRPLDSD